MVKFAAIEIPYEVGQGKDFGIPRIQNELNEWVKTHPEAEYLSHTVTFVKAIGSGPDTLLVVISYTVDPS